MEKVRADKVREEDAATANDLQDFLTRPAYDALETT